MLVLMTDAWGFDQVDVFGDRPLLGNPVAVVHDARGWSDGHMQRFTDWTNLSEATFLLAPSHPEADYAVRIFCPGRELPFAGHPTLGTCHAWLRGGGKPRGDVIVQECGAGLVRIRRSDDGLLAFAAPPLVRSGPLPDDDLARVTALLRVHPSSVVAHAWCDNGPPWRVVMLATADEVLRVRPDPALLQGMDVGVVGPHPAGAEVAFEVRAFFQGNGGLAEDPVTGSLNAALGQWLVGAGLAPPEYIASQGTVLGRAGRVHVTHDGGDVWVGGRTATVVHGSVHL